MSGSLLMLLSSTPFPLHAQFDTDSRRSQPGFWPTQLIYPRESYSGAVACADCHIQIFRSARQTSMARTAVLASESDILRSHPALTFSNGTYHYSINTLNGLSTYSASNGRKAESAAIVWAFGTNRVAQSWLFQKKDGEFHEVRVTYFQSLGTLDFTPGRALTADQAAGEADLEEAMDRELGRAEVYRCFACHTTASGIGSTFDESKLIPGVTCEACHGPGRGHIDEMENPSIKSAAIASHIENNPNGIFNPKKLSAEESVDFCGACHGSYWDISFSGSTGINNVRYPPYRLEQSKCWNKNDSRLTCIACHDPHRQVDTNAANYDHVCLSCHRNSTKGKKPVAVDRSHPALSHPDLSHPGAACPVAKTQCTSCHMPKVYLPDMHYSFADHRIRIARAGEPFPD